MGLSRGIGRHSKILVHRHSGVRQTPETPAQEMCIGVRADRQDKGMPFLVQALLSLLVQDPTSG
jgi:hypothetical protein